MTQPQESEETIRQVNSTVVACSAQIRELTQKLERLNATCEQMVDRVAASTQSLQHTRQLTELLVDAVKVTKVHSTLSAVLPFVYGFLTAVIVILLNLGWARNQ